MGGSEKSCTMKKLVSMILSLVLLMQAFPLVQIAAAEDGKTNQIPEMEIEEEILASDVFYLTAGAATLEEDGGTYLLRIARGGDCASYSGVTLRIADFTAKYGKDYTVSLLEGGEKADSPRENESLLEQMEGSEYTETPLLTEEEYAEMLASDSELQTQMEQGVQDAIDYIESQVSDGEAAEKEPYTLEDVKAAVTEQTDAAEEETSAAAVKETPATPVNNAGNDLQAARALYTGIDAEPQKVTGSADTLQQIQDMADVISKAVVGATLQVEFAPGESEKHIAIHVKDNNRGDGDRYFYFMLSEPTGTTTNSAASSCAFTILDDEEQTPSQVSFTQSVYQAEDGQDTVSVEIVRKGALNTIASVHLTTDSDDAVAGRDFSPVDTDVVFPIGIDKRTVNIPVCSDNLYQAADVTLTLDEPTACTVTRGSSEISLPAAELPLLGGAAEQAFSLTDIVLGDPVTISSPAETYLTPDHCSGCNFYHQDTPESYYDMVWKDNYSKTAHFFGDKQDGISMASWKLTEGYGADIAGAQIKWECKGSSSQNTVNFAGGDNQSSLSWATPSYKKYEAISKDAPMNFFGNKKFIKQVEVYNYGPGDSWNNTHVFSIKPIYRPFIIELASNYASTAAEEIKFLNADGTQTAWKDAAYLAIAGADNTNNSQVIRYTKEGKNSITFMQTVGGNVQTPYVTLNYVSANYNGQSAVFYKANSTVSNTYTTTLTSNWIGTNYTAIAFENNDVAGWPVMQNDVHALRGRITLQPHFSYKNATVKLIKPDNDYGYVKMSGTACNITADTSYTYHRGDIIKLETVINSKYKGVYEPAGYFIRYKQNASDSNWLCTMTIPVNADGAAYLDANERLQYGYYEVMPLYQLANNTITVRIKAGDEKYFDEGYGLFTFEAKDTIDNNYTVTVINGTTYHDYPVYTNPVVGRNYALTVRLATGKDGYMTWQENGKARQYVGEAFFHEASNSKDANIITLSYHSGSAGSSQRYISVSGTVTHPTYSMITHQVSTAGAEPASGALVNFGTGFGIAGADGSFTISPFCVPFDTGTDAYMRYIISLNGQELLKEVKLSTTNASQQTVYHIPDPSPDAKDITELTATVYKQSLQAQSISVENGSILNQIQVTPDSNSTGVITIPDGDKITIKVTVPTNYTYTKYAAVDGNGTVAETKNCKETVTGIDLIVCDSKTHQARQSAACEKKSSTLFQGAVDATTVLPGDELYIRVTTDRSHGVYTGADSDEGINSTVYTNAFTGYSFIQKTTDEIPVLQQIDAVPDISFVELPLVGDAGMNFDFPFGAITIEQIDYGYRMSVGVKVGEIMDTIKGTHMTTYGADDGAYYSDIFSIKNPIKSFKEGLQTVYNNAFKNAKELYAGNTAALGSPQWKLDVQVGAYFDFLYASITDPSTGYVTEGVFDTLYFTGVGGYIGVSGGVKMAWYTLLPVVFIPAYFGIDVSASVLGFFGAEKDTSKPEITFDDASHATVDFNSSMSEFSATVKMSACVQIYVGVGLAGTIGLRGGGQFDVMAQWNPSDVVDDWGCALSFSLGIWIDLFLFTIPVQHEFPDIKFGSFKQYETLRMQAMAANANAELTLRQPYSDEASKWVGDKPVVQAGFSPVSTQVIETNAYEHPEAQLLTLSDGRIFMAFLDTDTTREDTERTVLKYTIYNNGKWSAPVTVQDDNRADFQPSACEMENGQVMLAWISGDPAKATTDDAVAYLLGREVYTTVVDTKTGKIETPIRLTTDNYFDYTPTCVYVPGTGDRVVYYVKASNLVTGADGQTVEMTAAEMANSFANECAVVYMLYDKDEGKWLFDKYLPNELDNEEAAEQFIADWQGQRFLKNPIPELGLQVPNVTDFTAMAHDDLSVYAYTIDQDSSNDTQGDKEIFLQFCDLSTHKTYVPVRLTNDNTCDTLPKMVSVKRSGEATGTDLMLFWLRNEKDVAYLNISDLVVNGVDEKGKITEEYLTDDDGNVHSLEELYSYAEIRDNAVKGKTAMADFDVVVHEEDIYIVWTQPNTITDEEGNSKQSREVYASALIRNDSDGGKSVASDTSLGISWSDPYQLTKTGNFTDEPHAVINKDGKLMAVYNSYQQELTGDAEHPVEISDFELKATYMEPCGSIEVTDMVFSDPTPMPGDEVEVEMYVKNTGLTLAKDGYSVTVTGPKGSKLTQSDGSELTTITSDNKLLPGNTDIYYFTWTIPEKLDGLKLTAVSQETGMKNTHTYVSEELVPEPYYAITTPVVYQDNDGFHLLTTVTNEGNLISQEGDFLQVLLVGPYGLDERYESEERIFAEIPIDSVKPGECAEISAVLDVVPDVFDRYGFADCYVAPWNEEGMSLGEGEEIRIMPERPMELQLNNKSVPQMMILSAGSKKEFSMSCDSQRMNENLTVSYSTDDPDVAVFEGNTLHALQPGTVTVTGTVMPYGIEIQPITVSVWPSASDYLEALGLILPAAVKVISLLPVIYASPVKEDEPSSPTKETDKEEQTAQSEQTAETEQKTQSETIHQWESEFTLDTPATCTEAGEKSIHCKDCNDRKEITVIPALGHNWDEGTVTIEPTDETVGIMTYTCQRCGETKSEDIESTAEPSGEKEQEKTSGIATWQILTAAGVAAAAIAVAIIIIRRKKIH